MAALPEGERFAAWAEFMARESMEHQAIGITKTELRAAADATDDWIEANATSFNSALPQPARSTLTARQKKLLFMFIAARRFGVEL
jgi:hypothetical protein